MGNFFDFIIHPISAMICEDCIQFQENICLGSFLSLPFSICIHPYSLLSLDQKCLLSLKPFVGKGQEEHQETIQKPSRVYPHITGQVLSQNGYEQYGKQSQSLLDLLLA